MNPRIVLALALVALAGCAAEKPGPAHAMHPMVGEAVPELHQQGLDGESIVLPVAGAKVTLVDFFASWCEPCAKSLPEVDAFVTAHEADGVRLVLVSLDEDPDAAGAFLDRIGVKRPATLDPKLAVAKRFKVSKLPATFVVNGKGVIVWSGKEVDGAHDAALAELGQPAEHVTPAEKAEPMDGQPGESRPLRMDPPRIR